MNQHVVLNQLFAQLASAYDYEFPHGKKYCRACESAEEKRETYDYRRVDYLLDSPVFVEPEDVKQVMDMDQQPLGYLV